MLGYGGFFGLSSTEYRATLKTRTDQQLQKQEIVKTRRLMSCAFTVGGGIGAAVFTLGGSLVMAAVAGRKYRVADRKLKMIQDEITARDIPLHEFEIKDVLIPVAACLVGTAVGVAIEEGIANLVCSGDVATAGAGSTLAAMHVTQIDVVTANVMHPDDMLHGLGQGLAGQGHEVVHLAQHHVHEVVLNNTTNLTPLQPVAVAPGLCSENVAQLGGMQMGESAALAGERLAATQIAVLVMEGLEQPDWYRKANKAEGCQCSDSEQGTGSLTCNGTCSNQSEKVI